MQYKYFQLGRFGIKHYALMKLHRLAPMRNTNSNDLNIPSVCRKLFSSLHKISIILFDHGDGFNRLLSSIFSSLVSCSVCLVALRFWCDTWSCLQGSWYFAPSNSCIRLILCTTKILQIFVLFLSLRFRNVFFF